MFKMGTESFLKQVEIALGGMATDYAPPETEVSAVVHQWVHALVSKSELFASGRGASKEAIRRQLKKDGLYTTAKAFSDALRAVIHIKPDENPSFRFVDLFAGIGGMRQGFERAGGVCVFSSEYEKNAQSTYRQNFAEQPFGDITRISEEDIPAHDVLVAGFPCQPFSHAGLKLGIDDTRGTLFYDIARILKRQQPKVALLENVKGLVSHDKGHTLKVILTTLLNMGYQCVIDEELIRNGTAAALQKEAKKMILRSRDFGLPQNRQRIFIVLWRSDVNVIFSYPLPPMTTTRVGDILEKTPDPKYTISDRLWAGHKRRKMQNKKDGKGFGFGLVTPDSEYTNTISARYYKDGSEALIGQDGANPRKLTPKEAARLQGFPTEFILNPSDVQAYKQFGNSVSIPVIEAVAKKIKKII